ncbi:hypothetical protein GLAREA_03472 [Glarea lozoyensis ATCC 20868]|uniref:Uncharacterized protein n=1 Tax=Glarea lozoyensis (strain ATCC 20868 / MF5171) TaxID=1116229 RepID=S3CY18_GLAL2|nr:uncharacterized protein GLAREA_03472 [Glarea lozoyensis ATCC 20868]EPE30505.1 hypothetical protein GLAREA_03472 [Glarea lozoyensis ATCC 20868]
MINNILTHFIDKEDSNLRWYAGISTTSMPLPYANLESIARDTVNARLGPNKRIEDLAIYIAWDSGEGNTDLSDLQEPQRSEAIQVLRERGGRGYLEVVFRDVANYDRSSKLGYPDLSGYNRDGTKKNQWGSSWGY